MSTSDNCVLYWLGHFCSHVHIFCFFRPVFKNC